MFILIIPGITMLLGYGTCTAFHQFNLGGLILNCLSRKHAALPEDTIIYTSSMFVDELWPADSPAFVNTALARAPSPVYITDVRGANEKFNVRSSVRCLCVFFCRCRSLSWQMAQPSRDGIDATLTSM
jgi:hypothetical protein